MIFEDDEDDYDYDYQSKDSNLMAFYSSMTGTLLPVVLWNFVLLTVGSGPSSIFDEAGRFLHKS